MTEAVDAIILASGFSRRFGQEDKIIQVFMGKPLVAHMLELTCSLPSINTVFLMYASEPVADAASPWASPWASRVRLVRNSRPERGMCESIRLGVEASSADYYLFVHCDQPLLDAPTIDAVIACRKPGGIVVPCHAGNPGNPALFSSFFRDELLALPDGDSPRAIKQRYPGRVEQIEIDNPWPLRDMDTTEELRLFEKKRHKSKKK